MDLDGSPVPGAQVSLFHPAGTSPALGFSPTDAAGVARSEFVPAESVYLRADKGALSGLVQWRRTADPSFDVRIVVRAERTVEIQVVDGAGAPIANTQVGIADEPVAMTRVRAERRAQTDAKGLAQISVPGTSRLLLIRSLSALVAHEGVEAHAAFEWPERGPAMAKVQWVPPPGASLAVRFVEMDGEPASVDGLLEWRTASGAETRPWGQQQVNGGMARIRGLAAGSVVGLYLWEEGRLVVEQQVPIAGVNDQQEVNVIRGRLLPELRVPLVTRGGHPITNGSFRVYVRHTEGLAYGETHDLSPDDNGMLHVPTDDETAGLVEIAAKRAAGVLYRDNTERAARPFRTTFGPMPDPDPVYAVRTFPGTAAGAHRVLEPVVVDAPALTYRGRVVDSRGQPVPRVAVAVAAAQRDGEPEEYARLDSVTDRNGHFEFRAFEALPAGTYLCGSCDRGFCEPVAVGPPGEGVELRLQEPGALAFDATLGSIAAVPSEGAPEPRILARITVYRQVDAGPPGRHALFRQRRSAGTRDQLRGWSRTAYLSRDAQIAGLIPGAYSLKVFVGPNRVLALDEIRILSGEATRPPELQGVDFARDMVHTRVRVSRDGSPRKGARVRFGLEAWSDTLPNGCNSATDAAGEAWFVIPRASTVDLEVVASHAADWKRSAVTFPVDVELSEGASFDVEIVGFEELRPLARMFSIAARKFENGRAPDSPVQQVGGTRQIGHPQATVHNATGQASLGQRLPGRYRLWFCLAPSMDRLNREFTFVPLGDFEVDERSPARIPIRHVLTADELAILAK